MFVDSRLPVRQRSLQQFFYISTSQVNKGRTVEKLRYSPGRVKGVWTLERPENLVRVERGLGLS